MQTMFPTVASLGVWNWFILAVLLFILETVVPGRALPVVRPRRRRGGRHRAGNGHRLAVAVDRLRRHLGADRVLGAPLLSRRRRRKSDLPDLNVRANQYVGRSLIVEQAIQNGRGKVRVGDTLWTAEGPDSPAGARVTVKEAKGNVLVVERAAA